MPTVLDATNEELDTHTVSGIASASSTESREKSSAKKRRSRAGTSQRQGGRTHMIEASSPTSAPPKPDLLQDFEVITCVRHGASDGLAPYEQLSIYDPSLSKFVGQHVGFIFDEISRDGVKFVVRRLLSADKSLEVVNEEVSAIVAKLRLEIERIAFMYIDEEMAHN